MPATSRRFVSLLVACSGLTLALPPAAAAPDSGAVPGSAGDAADASRVLDRASALLDEGQLVRARSMLRTLQGSALGAAIDDRLDKRLWTMLAKVEREIQRADRTEIALQKAQHALMQDKLIEAERHAEGVLNASSASGVQADRARAVLGQIDARRELAGPRAGALIDAAIADFRSGDYAGAKTTIMRVGSLGLDLEPSQRQDLAVYRERIAELERTRGEPFDATPVSMGMLGGADEDTSDWLLATTQEMMGAQPQQDEPEDEGSDDDGLIVEIVDDGQDQPESDAGGDEPQGETDLIETARKFEAQTLLGQADLAYEERRLNDALDGYTRLINEFSSYVTPEELERTRQRLSEIEIALGVQGGPTEGGLEEPIQERSMILQRLEATYANLTEQAREALAQGNTSEATGLIAQARLEVQRARDVMPESRFEQYISELDTLDSRIAQRQEELRIQRLEEEKAQREQRTQELEQQRLRERDERILASLERVRELQQELKYEESLEIIENILFLDPQNPSALLLKEIIEDTIVYREFLGIQRDKHLSYAHEALDNQDAMIAPDRMIDYPDDWPAISFRRGNSLEFAESEVNRAVLTAMRETRLPVDFDNNALEDVIAFIGNTADLDIDVDWNALADIGVDPDTPVSLRLASVNIEILLDRVLAKASDPVLPASWAVQDGILTITSEDVLRQNTILEIYDINDLLVQIPEFDNAPDFNLQQSGGGGGGGGQSPFQGSSEDIDLPSQQERVTQITDLIQGSVDQAGWQAAGGSTSTITELNGNLIIDTTPRNHREIIGLLNKLRAQRAVQINVETRFLTVDQGFFERIGFDLDVYLNADNTEYQLANIVDPSLLPSDYFGPDGQLLDNVTGNGLFPIDTDGDGVADEIGIINQPVLGPGNNGGILPDGTVLPNDQFSVIGRQQDSFGLVETLAGATGLVGDVLGVSPALGVSGRFLDDVQVDFLVEATQADNRSTSLNAPRLTFMNGQRAFITVATSTSIVSGLTPIVGSSSGAFDTQIGIVNDGVLLDVSGTVSADRRYVTLTIQATLSDADATASTTTVTGAAGGGGTVGGNAGTFQGTIGLPVQDTTQLNTTVSVPDQGTVLLGGQRLVDEVEVETGVPVLSKIPVLSRFFSNRLDSREERTLLVLVKPTILIQNEEEERNFPGLLDQLGG